MRKLRGLCVETKSKLQLLRGNVEQLRRNEKKLRNKKLRCNCAVIALLLRYEYANCAQMSAICVKNYTQLRYNCAENSNFAL